MNPPKCRFCGKEEWSHVCKGAKKTKLVVVRGRNVGKKLAAKEKAKAK